MDRADAVPPGRVLVAGHDPEHPHRRRRVRGRRRSCTWRGACRGTGTRSCSAPRSTNVWGTTRSARSSRRCRSTCRTSRRARSEGVCSTTSRVPRARARTTGSCRARGPRPANRSLANDPHLLAVQPGAWIEMHLRAPGYEARGVALTFSPGILLGTTAHHAWGVTNVTGDVQDLYVEHLNEDRSAAEHLGAWEPLTIHHEEIHRPRDGRTRRRGRSPDAPRPDHRHRRRRGHAHRVLPAARDRHVRVAMDGAGVRHPAVPRARGGAGDELRGVPPGRVGRRVSRPELRVRGRRRHDRLPVHRPVPRPSRRRRLGPGAGLERRSRVGRVDRVRRAAVGGRSPLRLPGHREQPDPRRRVPASDRYRFPRAVPRAPRRGTAGRGRPARRRVDGADPIGHRVPPRAPGAPVAARAGADDRRRTCRPRAARRLGRRHVRVVRRRRRVQRVVTPHRPQGVGAAARRGAVPPVPRGSRGLPMRGPAGMAARSRRMARRRSAARGPGRRARGAPGAPGSGSVGVALGCAAPCRAGPSARLDPGSWRRCSRPRTTRSVATSRP